MPITEEEKKRREELRLKNVSQTLQRNEKPSPEEETAALKAIGAVEREKSLLMEKGLSEKQAQRQVELGQPISKELPVSIEKVRELKQKQAEEMPIQQQQMETRRIMQEEKPITEQIIETMPSFQKSKEIFSKFKKGELISKEEKNLLKQESLKFTPIERASFVIEQARRTAIIYDKFRKIFSDKQPVEFQVAQEALRDIMDTMDSDIKLVSSNDKSVFEVENSLNDAEKFVNDLEKLANDPKNQQNLRYWKTQGKDIQAEIIRQRRNIDNFRIRLARAAEQSTLSQVSGR